MIEKCAHILVDVPGEIGCGSKNGYGNSGFQALNIAVQFGVRRIALVGFDLRIDRGVHWHGRHARGLNNPGDLHMMHWRHALNGAADDFARLGIDVVNCSPVSTLTAYPVMTLKEAVA